MPKVEDIRGDLPGRKEVQTIANAGYAHARTAEVSAIAVVTILSGGRSYAGAFAGLTRSQRMMLVGELDALKAAILAHDAETFFEKIPD